MWGLMGAYPEEPVNPYADDAADEGDTDEDADTATDTAPGGPVLRPWHREPYVVSCSPGGNGYGPIRELGRFYEMLLSALFRTAKRPIPKTDFKVSTYHKSMYLQSRQSSVQIPATL